MPDLNRINYLSLFCSCVGHAAIVGGILYGLSDFREERVGLKRSTQPLVVELIPIDHMSDAKTGGAAPNHDEAPAVVPRQGTAPLSRPTKSLAEPIRLVSKPGDAVGTMLAPEGAGEHGSTTAADFSEYQRRLYASLARGSRYPAEARRLHLAGVTQLAFRIDRAGTVLESWIQESSGSELLDNAALEALTRAQPLPPIPAGLPARMEFVIEIDLSVMQQVALQTVG
ncbi:MAG: energy transducer TonB [Pseudomonadota bacterium]|jgi:protein TonB